MTGGGRDRHREPEIALVRSADAWVDDLHRHCADHGGARVRLMVLDPVVVLDEEFDVLVTSDRWPALTPAFVSRVQAQGRRVLIVGERGPTDAATSLGADALIGTQVGPSDLVAAVIALAPPARTRAATPELEPDSSPRAEGPARPGGVVAVGGPFGTGSTEVALALAAACVRRGRRAALIDADQVTPSIAARLGLPLEPNLCSALDALTHGVGALPGTLFDLGDDWPAVLVGAPNRRVASALRPDDVVAVGDALASRFDPVFVDVSAGAQPVHDQTDVCAAVVRHARAVVAVGAANPVGVIRLVEWIGGLTLSADTHLELVVNRAPSGKARRAELAGELQRDPRVAGLTFVPADPKVEDAVWSGSVVERGPFARAIDGLAVLVAGDLGARSASASRS